MKKQPAPRLLQWAEEKKGESISAGALSLNDVVAAAVEQENQKSGEPETGNFSPPKFDGSPEFLNTTSLSNLASVKKP